MISEKQIQNILQEFYKRGGEGYVYVSFQKEKELSYSPLYKEKEFTTGETVTTHIVFLKNKRKVIFDLDGFWEDEMSGALDDMEKMLEYAECDEDLVLPEGKQHATYDFSLGTYESMDVWSMEEQLEKVLQYNFQERIDIEAFSLSTREYTDWYINTLWAVKMQKNAYNALYVELVWLHDGRQESSYEYQETMQAIDISKNFLENLEQELITKLTQRAHAFPSWTYDIVLDRKIVGQLLYKCLQNLSAEKIRERLSFFSFDDIGKKKLSESLTVINNPYIPGCTHNRFFDDEWVFCKRTPIIVNGVVRNKFWNIKNARKEKESILGNKVVTNIEVIPEKVEENIFLGNSFYFTYLMAIDSIDEITGDFALNGEGYILENGEKKGFVSWVSLSWNMVKLFSHIKGYGNDRKKEGRFYIPSMSFERQTII